VLVNLRKLGVSFLASLSDLIKTASNGTIFEDATDADVVVDLFEALGRVGQEFKLYGQVGHRAGVFAHDADAKRQRGAYNVN
jgi:hypothetical protein